MSKKILLLFLLLFWPLSTQATSITTLEKAKRYYKAYEFEKAILLLEQARKTTTAKERRLEILLLLSLCHYKQTNNKQAIELFLRALKLDSKAKVPTHAPNALRFYHTQRQRWQKKKQQKTTSKRPVPPSGRPLKVSSEPRPPFRHTTSLVLYGASLVTVAVGVVLQVVSMNQTNMLETKKEEGASALEVSRTYNMAYGTAWGATILWSVSGAVAVTATGIFIHEYSTKPPIKSSSPSRAEK